MSQKTVYYRQCHLVKKAGVGELHQTSWLPESFAVQGQVLKLRDGTAWADGWLVTWVSATRLPEERLPDAYQEIRQHQQATGDALKKINA